MAGKFLYQTECRSQNDKSQPNLKRWHEDNTTGVFSDREEAIEDCLKLVNTYRHWQYRVVKYERVKVETFK